jgi:hypothetical protein
MESEQVVRFRDRIAALEAENAALWAFVRTADDSFQGPFANDWWESAGDSVYDDTPFRASADAREALRQYEEKP